MHLLLRAAVVAIVVLAGLAASGQPPAAQERTAQERVIRDIESRGFRNVTGLHRRGGNYLFQAQDLFGNKVRVVLNAETGEIVGLSPVMPDKK